MAAHQLRISSSIRSMNFRLTQHLASVFLTQHNFNCASFQFSVFKIDEVFISTAKQKFSIDPLFMHFDTQVMLFLI